MVHRLPLGRLRSHRVLHVRTHARVDLLTLGEDLAERERIHSREESLVPLGEGKIGT